MHSNGTLYRSGYFSLTRTPLTAAALFASNNERAFFVTQLQDLLSARSILEEPLGYRQLAAHLDLLAYSLLPYSAQLIIFAISDESAQQLSRVLVERLHSYQSEFRQVVHPYAQLKRLAGIHDALASTVALHLKHPDWEFDRYSSIGFYIHDRRGDWMRLWRLAHLYDNDSAKYLALLEQYQAYSPTKRSFVT